MQSVSYKSFALNGNILVKNNLKLFSILKLKKIQLIF